MPIWEHWETKADFQMDKLDPTESWYYTNFTLGCFAKPNLADFYIPLDSVLSLSFNRGLRVPATPIYVHNLEHFNGLDVWETRYFWEDFRQYPVIGLDPMQFRTRLVTVLDT